MSDALVGEDRKRNAIIAAESGYNSKSTERALYCLYVLVKGAADKMPLFANAVSHKPAQEQLDVAHKATHDSIYGKISRQGDMNLDKCIKYARVQKKDALYNWPLRRWFLSHVSHYVQLSNPKLE